MNAGKVDQVLRGKLGLCGDRRTGKMPQLVERASLRHPPQPDDAQPIAQRFDLGQDMAGEQHRSPLGLHLANAVLEYRLHERVESRCRFVEQEQFGIRRQRRNQSHFLPVPFRIGAGLLGRVELKTFEKLVAPPPIEVAPQPTEQIDHLPSKQVRPQTDLAGHVGQPAM